MPAVVAAGSIENIWDAKARIYAIHIWIAGAVIGLAFGPPIVTYTVTSSAKWPLLLQVAAGTSAVLGILCLGMKESRPDQLLQQRVKAMERKTSSSSLSVDSNNSVPSVKTFIRTSMTLPVRLFFTEPIIFTTSIMAATVYGVIYLFSESLPIVYGQCGFSQRESSLVFLALAAGVPMTFLPRLYDTHVASCKTAQPLKPEDKLFGFYVAAPVLAVAFWRFAWTIPPLVEGVSPWASIVSLVLVGYSVVEFDNVLVGYLTDTYASYAASANAPMAFLRAVSSGVFPLFGRQMFENLGLNYSVFILAGMATGYCGIAVLFRIYGQRLRESSPFAEKT